MQLLNGADAETLVGPQEISYPENKYVFGMVRVQYQIRHIRAWVWKNQRRHLMLVLAGVSEMHLNISSVFPLAGLRTYCAIMASCCALLMGMAFGAAD